MEYPSRCATDSSAAETLQSNTNFRNINYLTYFDIWQNLSTVRFYLFDHPFCIVRARRLFLQAVEDQVVPEERENKSKSFINHPADQMI